MFLHHSSLQYIFTLCFSSSLSNPVMSFINGEKRAAISLQWWLSIFLLSLASSSYATPPFSCDPTNPQQKSFPFCHTSLPIHQRVQDLVSRLTIDEKISQLVNTAPGIPRLGIPPYEWWSEALHGVSYSGPGINFNGGIKSATSFPQVILTSSSFDNHLWFRIGSVSPLFFA